MSNHINDGIAIICNSLFYSFNSFYSYLVLNVKFRHRYTEEHKNYYYHHK